MVKATDTPLEDVALETLMEAIPLAGPPLVAAGDLNTQIDEPREGETCEGGPRRRRKARRGGDAWQYRLCENAASTHWFQCGVRLLAAWLMVPYCAWLCFAAALNYDIMRLNPGAESLIVPAGPAAVTEI